MVKICMSAESVSFGSGEPDLGSINYDDAIRDPSILVVDAVHFEAETPKADRNRTRKTFSERAIALQGQRDEFQINLKALSDNLGDPIEPFPEPEYMAALIKGLSEDFVDPSEQLRRVQGKDGRVKDTLVRALDRTLTLYPGQLVAAERTLHIPRMVPYSGELRGRLQEQRAELIDFAISSDGNRAMTRHHISGNGLRVLYRRTA